MLSVEHIASLKLDRYKLDAHIQMPAAYTCKETTRRLAAVANAIIGEVMHVEPKEFELQLEAARSMGAAYVYAHDKHRVSGISAYASVVKDKNILKKNLILPKSVLWKHGSLLDHYILGVYLCGVGPDIDVQETSEIMLAGWTNIESIYKYKVDTLPFTFRSKLPVVAVPCERLNPMMEFVPQLKRATLIL